LWAVSSSAEEHSLQQSIYETDSPRWTLMGKDDYQVFYGKAAGVDAQGFFGHRSRKSIVARGGYTEHAALSQS
jgi:hypothetical protein